MKRGNASKSAHHSNRCDVSVIKVSTPEVWDVVRMEDDYKRAMRVTAAQVVRCG